MFSTFEKKDSNTFTAHMDKKCGVNVRQTVDAYCRTQPMHL